MNYKLKALFHLNRVLSFFTKEAQVTGECFSYAAKFSRMLDIASEDVTVVHGTVTDPDTSKKLEHAWVEYQGYVYDWQHEQADVDPLTVEQYTSLYSPISNNRYTAPQATFLSFTTGNFGPWTETERDTLSPPMQA
jgi:hypothetical protein